MSWARLYSTRVCSRHISIKFIKLDSVFSTEKKPCVRLRSVDCTEQIVCRLDSGETSANFTVSNKIGLLSASSACVDTVRLIIIITDISKRTKTINRHKGARGDNQNQTTKSSCFQLPPEHVNGQSWIEKCRRQRVPGCWTRGWVNPRTKCHCSCPGYIQFIIASRAYSRDRPVLISSGKLSWMFIRKFSSAQY